MGDEITAPMKPHFESTSERCVICYPPDDLKAFFNIEPDRRGSEHSRNFVVCPAHSDDEVGKKMQELEDMASQTLGYPIRGKLFRGPPPELVRKLDATRQPSPTDPHTAHRRMPYRQADHILRTLRMKSPHQSAVANERLTMSADQVVALSSAFAEIEVATNALAHAKDALAQVTPKRVPAQDVKKRLKGVRAVRRNMQQLADEEEDVALGHCVHSENFAPTDILYLAAAGVSQEKLPEQRAAIDEYLDRFFASYE